MYVIWIFSTRLRRVQQISTHYSKIWEAKAFNLVVKSLSRRSKNVLLSSCLAAVFDWEKDKIPDEVLLRYENNILLKFYTYLIPDCSVILDM